jgi:hypothetical protein
MEVGIYGEVSYYFSSLTICYYIFGVSFRDILELDALSLFNNDVDLDFD